MLYLLLVQRGLTEIFATEDTEYTEDFFCVISTKGRNLLNLGRSLTFVRDDIALKTGFFLCVLCDLCG